MTPSAENILAGFSANSIEKEPVSPVYRSGMLLVLLGMVLLPVAYLAFIALAAYLTWLWARHGLVLFSNANGGIYKLALYLAPIAAGLTLVFFMFKPLFFRKGDTYQPFILDENEEPALAAFARKIAAIVGAPDPVCIELNTDVNASARFKGGFSGMLSKKLTLTIGLPLIEGMTARSLAGIIAHEMGHFSQGSGMRVSSLVRQINSWFGRVVFERDKWDAALQNVKTSGGHWAVQSAAFVAECAVKAGRYVLLGLMKTGHAISCFMLRQMEYDADSVEAKVAGSDQFDLTSCRLQHLTLGAMKARALLKGAWGERRLPNNYAGYIVHHAATFTEEDLRLARDHEAQKEPHWYDTHPTTSQRECRVKASPEPGVFHGEEAATALCLDYGKLAQAVTSHHYVHELQLPMDRVSLVEVNELSDDEDAAERARELCTKFFGRQPFVSRPLGLPSPMESNESTSALQQRLREARGRMRMALHDSADARKKGTENDQQLLSLYRSLALVKVGFTVEGTLYGVTNPTEDDFQLQLSATKLQGARLLREQEPYLDAMQESFDSAVRLAMGGHNAGFLQACASALARCRDVGSIHYAQLRGLMTSIEPLLGAVQDPRFAPKVVPYLEELTTGLADLLARMREVFEGQGFPFEHWKGTISTQEYLSVVVNNDVHRVFQIYHEAEVFMMRYQMLYFRLLAAFIEPVGEFEPIEQRTSAE